MAMLANINSLASAGASNNNAAATLQLLQQFQNLQQPKQNNSNPLLAQLQTIQAFSGLGGSGVANNPLSQLSGALPSTNMLYSNILSAMGAGQKNTPPAAAPSSSNNSLTSALQHQILLQMLSGSNANKGTNQRWK